MEWPTTSPAPHHKIRGAQTATRLSKSEVDRHTALLLTQKLLTGEDVGLSPPSASCQSCPLGADVGIQLYSRCPSSEKHPWTPQRHGWEEKPECRSWGMKGLLTRHLHAGLPLSPAAAVPPSPLPVTGPAWPPPEGFPRCTGHLAPGAQHPAPAQGMLLVCMQNGFSARALSA